MAGDSATTDDDGDLWALREPKVWTAASGLVVGHAGNGEAFEALRYGVTWSAPRANTSLETWAHRDLVRMLSPAVAACPDESLLVGCRGVIWTLDIEGGHIAFSSPREPFAAVGTGGGAARAALTALRSSKLSAQAKLERALEAAEACRSDVRRPWHFVSC